MNKGILACLAVLSFAAIPCAAKEKNRAPLPPQLLTAKTVYIENQASAEMADKAYDELKKWGRFEVVTDRAKADLILLLSMKPPSSDAHGYSYLTVVDPKTGERVYSDAKWWKPLGSANSAMGDTIKELRKRIEAQEKQPSNK